MAGSAEHLRAKRDTGGVGRDRTKVVENVLGLAHTEGSGFEEPSAAKAC